MFKRSLPALAAILAYLPSLQYGFAQDDFINLYISRASNFGQFLNFFNPFAHFPELFFFRPLTTQVWYFLNQSLFGLNPLPFHIEVLALHIANAYLVFIAVKMLWAKKQIALISSILYALSATHFISLYYISTFQELGKTFFMLASVIFFAKNFRLASVLTFIGALLSKESAMILPLFLICFELLRRVEEPWKKVLTETLKKSYVFWVILIVYLGFRLIGFQEIVQNGGYSTNFGFSNILQNLKWYIIWPFGLPEILSTYPNLRVSSMMQFIGDFSLGLPILASFLVFIISAVWGFWLERISKKIIFLGVLIFLVPLLPVLVLNQHKYPQYLDLSLLGFLPLVFRFKKPLLVVCLVSFVILQILSIELTRQTHWSTKRPEVAKFYYDQFKKDYLGVKEGTTIIFSGTYQALSELSVDLARDYALKVWFPGKIKEVRYLESSTTDYVARTINNVIVKKVEIF